MKSLLPLKRTTSTDCYKGRAGDNSWWRAALLCFNLEGCFAVTEFGPNLVVSAKRVPDEKSGDKNEGEDEKGDDEREGRERTAKKV